MDETKITIEELSNTVSDYLSEIGAWEYEGTDDSGNKRYHLNDRFYDMVPSLYLNNMHNVKSLKDFPLNWFIDVYKVSVEGNSEVRWIRFGKYQSIVRELTDGQDLSEIANIDKRGSDYHLDHIVPITLGFKYDIPHEWVAATENLQIIPAHDNYMKNAKLIKGGKELLDKWLKKLDKPPSTEPVAIRVKQI